MFKIIVKSEKSANSSFFHVKSKKKSTYFHVKSKKLAKSRFFICDNRRTFTKISKISKISTLMFFSFVITDGETEWHTHKKIKLDCVGVSKKTNVSHSSEWQI